MDMIIKICDSAKYYDASLEDFVESILGKTHKILTIITNFLFNFSLSIANVIFAVRFLEFAVCELGICFADSKVYFNLIGLSICIFTCFIDNVKNFKILAMGAMIAV